MLKKSCANKKQDKERIPWGDIKRGNPVETREEKEKNKEWKSDAERGISKEQDYSSGGIQVKNGEEGTIWKCNECHENKETKGKLRNHMAALHRRTRTGRVDCPYCGKDNTHIGNLKAHITGYIGRKCKQIPQGKEGPEIWEDIVQRNPRTD